MKFKIIVISFLITFSNLALSNELRLRDYEKVINEKLTLLSVDQLGRGISWANTTFKNQKIYCAPKNLALNDRNYKRILDDEIKRGSYSDETYIGLILLIGIENTFPCK